MRLGLLTPSAFGISPKYDNENFGRIFNGQLVEFGGGLGGDPMHKRTTPKTFDHAKQLHRNMIPTEAKLWAHLRAHQMGNVHFRNQHAIGNYVVDFCAPRKRLIIELDGLPSVAAFGERRIR